MSEDARSRFGALTSEQVAAVDAAAGRCGVDVLQLMEVAGWQVARCAWRLVGRRPAGVCVAAGRGNNGGDALVAARFLDAWGAEVRCHVVTGGAAVRPVVEHHLEALRRLGVGVETVADTAGLVRLAEEAGAASLVLDGLLGTGLRSAPRSPEAEAIAALEGARVLAVDVPSGLDATSGEVFSPCVRATATCTLTAMKAGLWQPAARAQAGRIHVAAIGMPRRAFEEAGLSHPAALRGGAMVRLPD